MNRFSRSPYCGKYVANLHHLLSIMPIIERTDVKYRHLIGFCSYNSFETFRCFTQFVCMLVNQGDKSLIHRLHERLYHLTHNRLVVGNSL